MKDMRFEQRKGIFKTGILIFSKILETIGSMVKKREEFAYLLRKNKKQELLYKKRFQIPTEVSSISEESLKRLSEHDKIFSNPEVPLVFFNYIIRSTKLKSLPKCSQVL